MNNSKLIKRLSGIFLLAAASVGVGTGFLMNNNNNFVGAKAETATLTLDNLGSSLGSTSNTTMLTIDITATGTSDKYTLNYLQGKKQGDAILLAKSAGAFISNATAMPGDIKNVTVYINSGASGKTTYHCAFTTSACTEAVTTGSTAVNIAGGDSNKYTCSTSGCKYFCVSLGNANNGQVLKLDVEYEAPVEKTITALEVSGTPTTTKYEAGEKLDPTGLTVTGTYSDGSHDTITDGITWNVPTLTTGQTSCSVTATVGDVTSAAYTVNGLTVTTPKALSSIALTGTPTTTTYNVADSFSTAGLTVTATYSDSSTEDVTAKATLTATPAAFAHDSFSGKAKQSVSLTASYKEQTASQTYDVTVKGTDDKPFNVSEAVAFIDSKGTATTQGVVVKGKVSKVDSYYSTYHSLTYWIKDDSTSTEFEIYSGKGLNGADFSGVEDLAVGAELVILGDAKKFNSTYEFDKNSVILSIATKEVSSVVLSGTATKLEYEVGESFVPTGLTVTVNYTDGSYADVTSDATWNFDPETLSLDTTSVKVSANYGTNKTNEITVTGLTVTAHAFSTLIIREFYAGAGNNGSYFKDKYIVLTNPTTSSISLEGYSVANAGNTASFSTTYAYTFTAEDGAIASHENYVIRMNGGSSGEKVSIPYFDKDVVGKLNPGAQNGKVALFAPGVAVAGDGSTAIDLLHPNLSNDEKNITAFARNGSNETTWAYDSEDNLNAFSKVTVTLDEHDGAFNFCKPYVVARELTESIQEGTCNASYTKGGTTYNTKYEYFKTQVLAFTSAELNVFKTSENKDIADAKTTYEAWATANFDATPYAMGLHGVVNSLAIMPLMSVSNKALIIAATILSITTLGAVLLFRRKRA